MKQPLSKREKQDYRVLNDNLNEKRKAYMKAEIQMRMFTVRHPDTASGNYMDSERILKEIYDKIDKENN